MKNIITLAVLFISLTIFAQVGINNTSPKATLDISPKTTDGSKPEGLLIPQLDGNSLKTASYGTSQKGVIVYAKSAASPTDTKTVNVTAEGYYYFDGSVWQKMAGASVTDATTSAKGIVQLAGDLSGTAASPSITTGAVTSAKIADGTVANADLASGAGGIYKGSGSLSGNTTVTQGTNTLAFSSSATNGFSVSGSGGVTAFSVDGANNRVGIGTSIPSAALDVNSTQGGFVPPRMATSQRDVLISPPKGCIIFNTTTNQLELNTGTSTVPYWEKLLNSIPNSTKVEHSSLNIAPSVDMNLLTNNSGNWSEITQLKKTITVSVGAQIGVTFNCILNEFNSSGGVIAQADILVTVTPNATGLSSTLSNATYPRDSFALLVSNSNGQSSAIAVAKSVVATTTQYTVQVYVYRTNSPSNHTYYNLNPIYTNILVTN